MVLDQMWIEEECTYDISAMYSISYWWFQRQRFYNDRHTSEGDRRAVRTHMRILSICTQVTLKKIVLRRADLKYFYISMYGYDYMKKIVLRRVDLNEHVIAERDFNDDTLHQIDEALDYRVKEFKVNRMNPGLNTRFWTRKDVDRSKEFMFAIQKWLKTRRIFRNLESFVAVYSSLRSLKPKHTIKSRAKRSSKIISLGHYSIMLASLHTVKKKTDIKSPANYPCGIARDAELNFFKDVLVFRKMVEFLGAKPIKLKGNMWESKELIEKRIDWNKPPKEGDDAWHIKIKLIDPDGERFNRTFQSILTTRKLFEKENPREIFDLDHFYDS
nr:hypothetical protein [Tanacetum cinerariifolium]